jgi:hypothetical protein
MASPAGPASAESRGDLSELAQELALPAWMKEL